VKLQPEQMRRHKAVRAYLEEWRRERSIDSAAFAVRMGPVLQRQILRLAPAPAGTTLARNLEYVLRRLDACGRKIVDVLQFCRLSEATPASATCGSFCIVTHLCTPEEASGFIRLAD
jgi:hypothetical protein